MPSWPWLLSAASFAFAMSATPGPNNVMLAASSANFGFRRVIPHIAGVTAGFPVMLLAAGFAGSPLLADPSVQHVVKWVGTAYLLWLAWKIATARPSPANSEIVRDAAQTRPITFIQAATFQFVNPKAWIVVAATLSNYTIADNDHARQVELLLLVAIFAIFSLPGLILWALVGTGTGRLLKSSRAMRLFNFAVAGLLVASLATLK